jgi:hypothetical protein
VSHAGTVLGMHDGVSVAKLWPSSAATRCAPRATGPMSTGRLVEGALGGAYRVHDVRRPFWLEPDFGLTSVNYDLAKLLTRAEGPT